MMEVSHFELIFKRQAPVDVPNKAPLDTVLQGYFLEITNLETIPLQFRLEFVALPPAPGQTQRSLAGNTLVFIDTPGQDNGPTTLAGGFGATSFSPASGLIAVAPNATALVAVLPSAFGATPLDPTPLTAETYEVRGFVRISLPALRQNVFFSRAQASAPVRVMLTPQNRTTYFRPNGNLSDQTQAGLPTATGACVNLIAPDPSRFIFPQDFELGVARALPPIPIELRPSLLMAMLADLDDDPASLRALNAALAEMEAPLAVERRAARAPAKPRPEAVEPA